jgi:hypothetical protein
MMSDNFEFCMHVCEAGWYHGDIFLAEVSFLIALFATLDINLVKSRFYPNSIQYIPMSNLSRSSGSGTTGVARPPTSPRVKIVRARKARGPPAKKAKRDMDASINA